MYVRKTTIFPLIGITVFIFILQAIIPGFTQAFYLVPNTVLQEPWTIVTTMFLHGGIAHLLLNMYALLLFGSFVEQKIGWKNTLKAYFITGIVASIVAATFYYFTGQGNVPMVGASGAVMGLVGMLIMLMPQLRVLFFFFVPMPLWVAGFVFFFLDVFNTLANTGIAGIAHIGGMVAGLVLGYYFKKYKPRVRKMPHKMGQHMSSDDIDEYMRTGRL